MIGAGRDGGLGTVDTKIFAKGNMGAKAEHGCKSEKKAKQGTVLATSTLL